MLPAIVLKDDGGFKTTECETRIDALSTGDSERAAAAEDPQLRTLSRDEVSFLPSRSRAVFMHVWNSFVRSLFASWSVLSIAERPSNCSFTKPRLVTVWP